MITKEMLDNWFTYHAPTQEQVGQYSDLRTAALDFAETIVANTPPGAEQNAAVQKVREAVMTANAAIACGQSVVFRGRVKDATDAS